jgi:Ribbon-helix-helix protein, copG family
MRSQPSESIAQIWAVRLAALGTVPAPKRLQLGTFQPFKVEAGAGVRPALGSAPASVESVRLDPELRDQLLERAKAEGTTTSEVIREALRRFLKAAYPPGTAGK